MSPFAGFHSQDQLGEIVFWVDVGGLVNRRIAHHVDGFELATLRFARHQTKLQLLGRKIRTRPVASLARQRVQIDTVSIIGA